MQQGKMKIVSAQALNGFNPAHWSPDSAVKQKDLEDQGRSLDSCIKWDLGFIQNTAQSGRNLNPEQMPN